MNKVKVTPKKDYTRNHLLFKEGETYTADDIGMSLVLHHESSGKSTIIPLNTLSQHFTFEITNEPVSDEELSEGLNLLGKELGNNEL